MKPSKKCSFDIRQKLNKLAIKTPYFLVFILMLTISPLGVYLFVMKNKKDKIKMYTKGKGLISAGIFIVFLMAVGIYSKVKEVIELLGSGMSLDMINFIPDNFSVYIIVIIVVISYVLGGKTLLKRSKVEQQYTHIINFEHKEKIKDISKELQIPVNDVKSNIRLLQKSGYLIPLEIDNNKNKIIYDNTGINSKVIVDKKTKKRIQCDRCGALIQFKLDEYLECDFCGHAMIEDDK